MGPVIDEALRVLERGGLIAIPTETVYGLAANADDETAVQRVFSVKGRPTDHPLIVHVAIADHLGSWAASVPPAAEVLAATCWPGPLTLLVPAASRVLPVVTGGRPTVGIRVPAHPLTTQLLEQFSGPTHRGLAAPSANRFGQVSPTSAEHVQADLGGDVDLILDGGPCPIGVESTIVDCTVDPPQVLRPGGISAETIAELLHGRLATAAGPSRASGMLASHYAPACRVLLAESRAIAEQLALDVGHGVEVIDRSDDLVGYARDLYAILRDADARGVTTLVAVLPPPAGLGHAIRDRLTKAAAPR
ncbi:unnamed protein product [Phaeothamnion confervicola]